MLTKDLALAPLYGALTPASSGRAGIGFYRLNNSGEDSSAQVFNPLKDAGSCLGPPSAPSPPSELLPDRVQPLLSTQMLPSSAFSQSVTTRGSFLGADCLHTWQKFTPRLSEQPRQSGGGARGPVSTTTRWISVPSEPSVGAF